MQAFFVLYLFHTAGATESMERYLDGDLIHGFNHAVDIGKKLTSG
jgi:hypothetical protein